MSRAQRRKRREAAFELQRVFAELDADALVLFDLAESKTFGLEPAAPALCDRIGRIRAAQLLRWRTTDERFRRTKSTPSDALILSSSYLTETVRPDVERAYVDLEVRRIPGYVPMRYNLQFGSGSWGRSKPSPEQNFADQVAEAARAALGLNLCTPRMQSVALDPANAQHRAYGPSVLTEMYRTLMQQEAIQRATERTFERALHPVRAGDLVHFRREWSDAGRPEVYEAPRLEPTYLGRPADTEPAHDWTIEDVLANVERMNGGRDDEG